MKKTLDYVAGIDVSKRTFDIYISKNGASFKGKQTNFSNDLQGYEALKNWLLEEQIEVEQVLFCLENTGIYHRQLVGYLVAQSAYVWVESAVQIKWSMGVQRGKSDRIDSERIMRYAYRHQEQAVAYQLPSKSLGQLADCMALRERLMGCITTLRVPVKECRAAGLEANAQLLEQAYADSLASLKKELKALEVTIKKVIEQDTQLAKLYDYTTSVRCVGFVAACYFLIYTKGFTRFETPKQFASYSGVAPFEYSSGTSIKGRTKVHHMANKKMKKILHLCAVSSVRHNPEMKAYFERKVAEGKNKMLVLNAIRNKIIQRVFTCVKNQRHYQLDYQRA